ncbi:MAG: hypothetical protein AAFX94_07565, partial [Myxococcota bacterium]
TTATNDGSCLPILDGEEGLGAGCPGNLRCDGSDSDCPSNCAGDADCDQPSHFCNASNDCQLRAGDGATCSSDSECSSGFCTDNVCCNVRCNGECNACDVLSKTGSAGTEDGECGAVLAGTDPEDECGVYFCTGGPNAASALCDTNCDSNDDGQCKVGTYCDASSDPNTCEAPLSSGACEGDRDCASGFCTDGMCCNERCDGDCEQCTSGSCTPYAAGTDPEGDCGDYVCAAGGACHVNCATNDDGKCAMDRFCDAGLDPDQCVPLGAAGDACEANTDCQVGLTCAAEGVCCDLGCSGECESCLGANTSAGAGNDGACLPVSQGLDPKAVCDTGYVCDGLGRGDCASECAADTGMCDASVAVCAAGFYCNDTGSMGACEPLIADGGAPEPLCVGQLSESCENVAYTEGGASICCESACSGECESCFAAETGASDGACEPASAGEDPKSACTTGYVCDGSAVDCPESCTDDGDCAGTHYCNGGVCDLLEVTGTFCDRDAMCGTGVCADGFCCDSACDLACESCAAADTGGTDGVCAASTSTGVDTDGDPVSPSPTCGGPIGCGMGPCSCDGFGVCN